jgi:hypothetical protein
MRLWTTLYARNHLVAIVRKHGLPAFARFAAQAGLAARPSIGTATFALALN